jgi:hypothetical protein
MKVELLAQICTHWHTYETLCVSRHEVYVFRGGELSGAYHIALVLTVLIVCDEDDLAVSESLAGLLDSVVLKH